MRAIRSARLAPVREASVFPVCRRSWKWKAGKPTAATESVHSAARWKFERRSLPPLAPVKIDFSVPPDA